MNFLAALSRAGPAAFQGYNDETAALDKQRQMREQQQGNDAYGAILRSIAAQQSMATPRGMPSTGSFQPMQPGGQPPSNMIPFQPGGIPQMKPMGGPPTASPMPGGPPPGQPPMGQSPTGQPMPGQPPMGQPQGGQPMRGQPDSMSRPMTGGGNQPNQGGGNPLQNLTLQQIMQGIKQTNPGISDAALGIAMDKFLPLMNAQAQLQYRMGMLGVAGQRVDLGRDRLNETNRHNTVNEADRGRRLDQLDLGLAQRDEQIKLHEKEFYAKVPPAISKQGDALRVRYQQDGMNYRQAQRDVSFHPGDPDYTQAMSDARAIYSQSQREYMDFIQKLTPDTRTPPAGGYLYGLPVAGPPAGAPAQGTKPSTTPAKPAAAAPAKPATTPQPIGKGPGGQPLFPLAPGQAWGGQGGYDAASDRSVNEDGSTYQRHRTREGVPIVNPVDMNTRLSPEQQSSIDQRNTALVSTPTPVHHLSPEEIDAYARGGQKPLSELTHDDLAAVTERTQKNRGAANLDQGDNSTLGRFVRDLDVRRTQSSQAQKANEIQGNNTTSGLSEQNDSATDSEAHALITLLAKKLGIDVSKLGQGYDAGRDLPMPGRETDDNGKPRKNKSTVGVTGNRNRSRPARPSEAVGPRNF